MSDESNVGARPRPRPRPAPEEEPDAAAVSLEKAEPDTEPEAPDEARPRGGWIERAPWLVAAGALVAAWVLVGLCLWLSHGVWWGKPGVQTEQREKVLAAAKSCIADLNTYDYNHLDQARAKALACTTGDFTSTYGKAFDTQVVDRAKELHAVQKLEVLSAGIAGASRSGDQWDVLMNVQISITTVQFTADNPQLSLSSLLVTMQRSGDKWLISAYKTAP